MDDNSKAFSLIALGFNDYIASRHLIHSGFILQGVTLSSSAIEKYLKFILAYYGMGKKEIGVHLNRIDKLKKLLSECYYDITEIIDSRFLKILGDAYSIRYYDELTQPVTIGFFINQFIGELDFTINLLETKVITHINDENGNPILTQYKKNIEERNEVLFLNNYILNNISKKEHMEKEDSGFCIYINPQNIVHGNILVQGHKIKNKYNDGRMTLININFDNKVQ